MTGYGAVARETAAQAHERKVQAIEAVLRGSFPEAHWLALRRIAEQCLDAAETGI